jgi:CBS domain-containing protein
MDGVEHVFDLMTRHPITVPDLAPLEEVRARLEMAHVTGLPVVDARRRVVGVITETDLVRLARYDEDGPRDWHRRRVRDAMTSPALTIGAWAPVKEAARLLLEYGVHRLVVVDEEQRLVGIISTTDFVRLAAEV